MLDEPEVPQDLPEGEPVLEAAEHEAPETATEQAPEQPEEEAPKPKHKPWFQERIDQLTREKHEERRRAEALEARLKQSGDLTPEATPDSNLVEQKAQEIVRQRQFDEKCNAVYSSGATDFPDFDDKLANFRLLGGLPPTVLEAVTELPDAHKVLHALGSNMDEAARIFNLPPVPMAVALAKLSGAAPKAKPVSSAPPPIRPIDGTPTGSPDPDKMSVDEWVKWREAEIKKNSA